MEDKSLWQIIKGTVMGTDGHGSSKRATSFYIVTILITSLLAVYEYCFYKASLCTAPTTAQLKIVSMYEGIHFLLHCSLWMFAGLATIETVTNLIKVIRGYAPKETEPKQPTE